MDNRNERKIFNFNLSHIVKGHSEYAKKLTQILDVVGVRVTPLSKASRSDLETAGDEPEHGERSLSTPPDLRNEKGDGELEVVRLKLRDDVDVRVANGNMEELEDEEVPEQGQEVGEGSFRDPLGARSGERKGKR